MKLLKKLSKMDYEKYIADGLEIAKKKASDAAIIVSVIEFSQKVYATVLEISDNQKFAYKVAKDFSFERVLNSKEFLPDEKAKVQELADYFVSKQYKSYLPL